MDGSLWRPLSFFFLSSSSSWESQPYIKTDAARIKHPEATTVMATTITNQPANQQNKTWQNKT